MSEVWPTRQKDLLTAEMIMEQYAREHETENLGLFEIVVDTNQKKMNFRLSGWVMALARHFSKTYGEKQGDYITRQVVSRCIVKDEVIH